MRTLSAMTFILDSYARESAAGDKRNLSIEGQHTVNVKRIESLGGTLGEKLSDKGRSAWRRGVVRHDWERAIQRLESGASNGVVIYDIERLLRRVEDALRIVRLAEEGLEKGFMVHDSDLTYDLTSVSGQEAFYNAAVKGQAYSHRLSGKIKRSLRTRALSGEGKPNRVRPLGFEPDATTVRESEREPLRIAHRMARVEGKPWHEVVEYLTNQGLRSTVFLHTEECKATKEELNSYKRKLYTCECPAAPLTIATVRAVLKAPRMAGYVVYQGEIVGSYPGEPIIDPTDWQELNVIIASRRGRPRQKDALATGLKSPVRCADCQGVLMAAFDFRGSTYEGTELAKYAPDPSSAKVRYRCSPTSRSDLGEKGCGRFIADVYVLDHILRKMVIAELSNSESANEVARQETLKAEQRKPHEKEIGRLELIRAFWDNKLNSDSEMTIERHQKMTGDIDKKIANEKAALIKIGELKESTPVAESVSVVSAKWDAADPATKREMLWQAFGERTIYITPGSTVELEKDVAKRIHSIPKQTRHPLL